MRTKDDSEFLYPTAAKIRKKESKHMHNATKRLIFINSIYYLFYGLIEPFMVIYFNDFGSIESVGISIAILCIMQGLISLFVSKILSKIDARLVVSLTSVGEGIRTFGFIFAPNVYFVYLLQFFGGILEGFRMPAYDSLFVKICKDESDTNIGTHTSVTTLIYGLSALVSGFIINMFSYTPIFIIWGLQEIFYGIYIYFVV